MALSMIEPTNTPKPQNLIGVNYDLALHQSIQTLVAETQKEIPNFSPFIIRFYELMQSKTDPPTETIWIYSALSFKTHKTASNDLKTRVSIATDLFKLVTSCSSSSGSSKSIALLVPVIYELYKLVIELFNKDFRDKRVKKLIKKLQSLIGLILGYMGVCCGNDLSGENDSYLIAPFSDLVALWVDGKDDGLSEFLPLVNNEILIEIRGGRFSVKYLAGVVIMEMFLLKLCFDLRIKDGISNGGMEFEKELRSWAVASISGFRSCYLFDMLVGMLLDFDFPVASFLIQDKTFLRKILYDVAILPEYSFLNSVGGLALPADQMRSLAMKRLIMTYEAVEFTREKFGDLKRAVSYSTSFSSSQLSSQIIKWITNQIGVWEETSNLNELPPKSLLTWLWSLKRKGIVLFDCSISEYLTKFVPDDDIKVDNGKTVSKPDLFYIDNNGDEIDDNEGKKDETEAVSTAFVAAARTMRVKENGRKRKDTDSADGKKQIKLPKLSDDSDSDGEPSLTMYHRDSNSQSEVENPTSEED